MVNDLLKQFALGLLHRALFRLGLERVEVFEDHVEITWRE